MEKICKRCNFRTPAARAVCQVCGHAKFHPYEAEVKAAAVAMQQPTPSFDAGSLAASAEACLQNFHDLVTRKATALRDSLTAALTKPASVAETTSQFPRVQRTYEQPTAKVIELPTHDESLEDLVNWFKTFGVNEPILFPSTAAVADSHETEPAAKAA